MENEKNAEEKLSGTVMSEKDAETFSITVTEMVERFLEVLAEASRRVTALETLCALQQAGLEKLGAIVDGHQRTLEALTGYKPPAPAKALDN